VLDEHACLLIFGGGQQVQLALESRWILAFKIRF